MNEAVVHCEQVHGTVDFGVRNLEPCNPLQVSAAMRINLELRVPSFVCVHAGGELGCGG